MININNLPRNNPTPNLEHSPSHNNSTRDARSGGVKDNAVSFLRDNLAQKVNFGENSKSSAPAPTNLSSSTMQQPDIASQIMSILSALIQHLQSYTGAQSNDRGHSTVVGSHKDKSGQPTSSTGAQASENFGSKGHATGSTAPASGNFSEHTLGKQLSVQKSAQDNIGMVKDPERGDVVKVDFQKGHYTEHSTSPRAEIKDGTKLEEGKPYSFKFGMKREANNDGTFFQVLDHNNAKPSPRAWLASKNGQYQLHLKTSPDSNAPSKTINIGKPGDAAKDVGKWADFQIDFKRGVGDGTISVSKNGQQLYHASNLSTMFETHSKDSYAKFGQYRNEGDHKAAISYFSNFSVSS